MSKFSRRSFLAAGAAGLGSIPFLSTLPRIVGAADAPTRVLFVITHNGCWDENYFPNIAANAPTSDGLGKFVALPSGNVSNTFRGNAPWSKMSLLRGLDVMSGTNSGHNRCAPLNGSTTIGGVFEDPIFKWSIDTVLSESAALYPQDPIMRSLRITTALNAKAYNHSWSWRDGAKQSVTNLQTAYNTLIGDYPETSDAPTPTPMPMPEPTPTEGPKLYGAAALERIEQRYRTLGQSPRIGSADKQRLDAYLTHLKAARPRVERDPTMDPPPPVLDPATSGCAKPGMLGGSSDATEHIHQMWSLISSSFACDLTRVATVDLRRAAPGAQTDAAASAADKLHHEASHYPAVGERGAPAMQEFTDWQGARVIELLNMLDGTPDVDGRTLLDNTLVVWTNELGWGNAHTHIGTPVMLAGATSHFAQGRYYDFRQDGPTTDARDQIRRYGLPYNRLFMSIFDALGVPQSDYDKGNGGFGEYAAVDSSHQGVVSAKRAALPILI